MSIQFQTPILLLIFNRLETTKKVLNIIRAERPKFLFIACDGPRHNRPDEASTVNTLREYVLKQIDWDCEIKTLFREENFGCGKGVSNAITWFFNHVEQGIILEDDCLPLPGFFQFCEEMLAKYKYDDRIYEISGTNLQGGRMRGDCSYYFSNFVGIWGWATWARAWKKYDFKMSSYSEFKLNNQIGSILSNRKQQKYWIEIFDNLINSKIDTWDYQWVFAIWMNSGLCIIPNNNLIINDGFNEVGTHTFGLPNWYSKLTASNNDIFPVVHPSKIEISREADDFLFAETTKSSFRKRLSRLIMNLNRKLR